MIVLMLTAKKSKCVRQEAERTNEHVEQTEQNGDLYQNDDNETGLFSKAHFCNGIITNVQNTIVAKQRTL